MEFSMQITILPNKETLGKAAADAGASAINDAIAQHGHATVVLATGASQFDMLQHLVQAEIDWSVVDVFHLDEYIGIAETHSASFRKYLKERFLEKVRQVRTFNLIEGDAADPEAEVARLNGLLDGRRVDLCFAGIGENCHLAFNDPPADFEADAPYIIVELDEACRRQQMGEGWFKSVEDVPAKAISMSVRQIMRSKKIVLCVSDERKAAAVAAAVNGPVSNLAPASMLQQHSDVLLFLDPPAASQCQRSSSAP